jgi:hypothetical protein
MMRARFALALTIALAFGSSVFSAAPQPAQSGENIRSPKYDVRVEVLPDGSLDVTESVTLTVGAKPMTWFDRKVPRRRTDGFTGVVALMDGQAVPVAIDARNDLEIRWDFSPTANATHTFEMRYRALHVLAREIDGPRLVWTALPVRHTYPIEAAAIALFAPAGAIATYVGAPGGQVLPANPDRPGLVIAGTALSREHTVTVDITFAPNSIKPVEPQWFIEQQRQLDMLPAWIAGAACLLVVGIGIVIMSFARLSRPPAAGEGEFVTPASEGSVPAGLAAWLIGGSAGNSWLPLQAAFFRLVRDGYIVVEKRGGGRLTGAKFDVSRGARSDMDAVGPHERLLLDAVEQRGAKADLRRLMMRWSRRQRVFRSALHADAAALGWVDEERQRTRSWLQITGLVLLFSGLLGGMALTPLIDRFGPAPIAIPAAVFVTGLIYLIVSAATSVISEAGLREAARWKARVGELKAVIKNGADDQSPQDFERWFPLAIGARLGRQWLKVFAPILTAGNPELGWLKLMGSPADAAASLGMMMAVSHSSHSGGAGGAGGGAGGGSSGAG